MTQLTYDQRKKHLIKEWRGQGFGRLYWRQNNRRWYRVWDRGMIAKSEHFSFYSIDAIAEVLGVEF